MPLGYVCGVARDCAFAFALTTSNTAVRAPLTRLSLFFMVHDICSRRAMTPKSPGWRPIRGVQTTTVTLINVNVFNGFMHFKY